VSELLATLAWLGPHARSALPELDELRAQAGLSRALRLDLDRALQAIRRPARAAPSCCGDLPDGSAISVAAPRRPAKAIESISLQDQDGNILTFGEFFRGRPSIVVFFYTRCDNPLKCSLTVAKLARVQALLETRGLTRRIRTAAITYDPAFDLPQRLRVYGQDRSVRLDEDHRMLRAVEDNDALREHFELGVNFIESLVNRHRIELYILDAEGRVAVSFERIHWDEADVVARAAELLKEAACAKAGREAGR
jgi:protein SCO1/2